MRGLLQRAAVLGLLGLTACGGDGGGDALGPAPSLTGAWRFTEFTVSGTAQGVAVSCSLTGMSVQLAQSGGQLSGTHSSATFSCSGGGQSESAEVPAGQVAGSVAGTQVTLRLDEGQPFSGTLSSSGAEIRGPLSIAVPDFGTFSGLFVLTRSS